MNPRPALRRLVVPSLVAAMLLVAAFVFLRSGEGVADLPPDAPVESTAKSSQPAATAPRQDLPRSRAPLTPTEAASVVNPDLAGTDADRISSEYAAPDRWRATPVPCWRLRGTAPEDFVVKVDSNLHTAGKASALLASIRDTNGWGTLYQYADAKNLRGKRIEFSADVRTEDVQREANLPVSERPGEPGLRTRRIRARLQLMAAAQGGAQGPAPHDFRLDDYGWKSTISGALGVVDRPSALTRNLVTRRLVGSVVVKPGPPAFPAPELIPSAVK